MKPELRLSTLLRLKTLAYTDREIPDWFRLLPIGNVEMEDGEPAFLSIESAQAIVSEFKVSAKDMVIDYEHQTVTDPPIEAPAAGWIKDMEVRADGLYVQADWVERAAQRLKSGEYRYFSPVFMVEKKSRNITALFNVALTNQPRLKDIRPILNKHMGDSNMLKEIKELLGVQEDGKVVEAVKSLIAAKATLETEMKTLKETPEPVACKEVLEALKLRPEAAKSEVVATIHALAQEKPDTTAELASLKARLADRDANDLVADALKAGKISAAQKEWAKDYAVKDPEGFRIFVAKAPQVVPVTPLAPATMDTQPVIDAAIVEVAKQMGVSIDDVKKSMGGTN